MPFGPNIPLFQVRAKEFLEGSCFLKTFCFRKSISRLISPGPNRSQGALGSPAGVSARPEDPASSPKVLSYITSRRTRADYRLDAKSNGGPPEASGQKTDVVRTML